MAICKEKYNQRLYRLTIKVTWVQICNRGRLNRVFNYYYFSLRKILLCFLDCFLAYKIWSNWLILSNTFQAKIVSVSLTLTSNPILNTNNFENSPGHKYGKFVQYARFVFDLSIRKFTSFFYVHSSVESNECKKQINLHNWNLYKKLLVPVVYLLFVLSATSL